MVARAAILTPKGARSTLRWCAVAMIACLTPSQDRSWAPRTPACATTPTSTRSPAPTTCPARGVRQAIMATAHHRSVDLAPLGVRIGAFATMRARTWEAYRRSLGRQGEQLPEDLADVVAHVAAFADRVLGGSPADARWVAASRTWTTTT